MLKILKMKLTKRNHEVLDYIEQYYDEHGTVPTHEEIAENLGFNSRFTITHHIRVLKTLNLLDERNLPKSRSNTIEVIGDIAAGSPIESSEIIDQLDGNRVFKRPNCIWLRVKGDSMCELGLNSGDYVQIRKTNEARNGDIVAAYVDGYACTLKEYEERGNNVVLKPFNKLLDPITVSRKKLSIYGIYTGVNIQKHYFDRS